jgi:hypothetical protein
MDFQRGQTSDEQDVRNSALRSLASRSLGMKEAKPSWWTDICGMDRGLEAKQTQRKRGEGDRIDSDDVLDGFVIESAFWEVA